ncbi:MAG TPA: LAGLIDADG family homing endonuclease [Candidatus Norongarragalinales archaeon]|jgi:intein/homing endonuclease|nr:LAGLIDADG family homing endonuclease [Candidatus Norongarragalinales archaeon]
MLPEEASVAAHICGDGWIGKFIEKKVLQVVQGRRYWRDRMRYAASFCNTDKALLESFRDEVKIAFGIKCRMTRNQMHLHSKRVYDRLQALGAGSSRAWTISDEIFQADYESRRAWIRAFFDDESTVDLVTRRIRVKSVNGPGLEKVHALLVGLGINGKITGPNIEGTWYLTLSKEAAVAFANQVGSRHSEKVQKLHRLTTKLTVSGL